jgi:UDPglucose 6-dehydrogenase
LLRQGAIIRSYDPVARAILSGSYSQVPSATEAVKGAHALLVLTEWSEFSDIDAAQVAAQMKGSIVYDTRRVLDRNVWQSKFEVFERLGESSQ